ncbi:MAG: gamma-glutamylcyclotransferase [Flammeovirgaceae bacterium]
MNQSNLFAFYGSLRRGMENYEPLKENLHYQFSTWLTGYQLYSLGPYPFAIRTDSPTDKILVEVFEVNSLQTEQTIHQIEMEAGYFLDSVSIDGQAVKIYLYENKADYPFVFGGDWIKFFRG